MAYPTFGLAGVKTVGNSSATISVAWPAHQIGDLGYLIVETQSGFLAAPTGWALASTQAASSGATDPTTLAVYYLRATSTSMPNATVPAGVDHSIGAIVTFKNAEKPPASVATTTKSTRSTALTFATVTTTIDEILIVGFASHGNDGNSAGIVTIAPSGNTNLSSIIERFDDSMPGGSGGGIFCFTGTKAAAGVVGVTSATIANSQNVSVTVALQYRAAGYRLDYSGGTSTTGTLPPIGTIVQWDTSEFSSTTGTIVSIGNNTTIASGFIVVAPNNWDDYNPPYATSSAVFYPPTGTQIWSGNISAITVQGAVFGNTTVATADAISTSSGTGTFTVTPAGWQGYWGFNGINPGISP